MFGFEIVREETFTFTPNDGTPEITIMSGQLRQWLLANAMDKVTKLTFPEGETEADLIQRHGLELDRMASMTVKEAKEPVILGLHPSGTHILIDGGHRRWFWWKRGRNILKGWIVPTEVWQQFLMDPLYHMFALHHAEAALIFMLEAGWSDIEIPDPYNQSDISAAVGELDIDFLFSIQEIAV